MKNHSPRPYLAVPVAAAVDIATKYRKSMVVILAFDNVHQKIHTTTYGESPQEKRIAAKVGEACCSLVADVNQRETYEDFAAVEPSQAAAFNEKLARLLRWCVAQFDGDSGTGATHWEQFPEYREAVELLRGGE